MRKMVAVTSMAVVMLGGLAVAGERARVADALPAQAERLSAAGATAEATSSLHPGIDLSYMDRFWQHSNGIMEYEFTPPPQLSPPPAPFPRPAVNVASQFLQRNASLLLLEDPKLGFQMVSEEDLCDGSRRIVLEQTAHGYPVEGTFLSLTIRDEVVKQVAARLVEDGRRLPVCAPLAGGDSRYLPLPSSIIFTTTIEELGNQTVLVTKDACSGLPLSTTTLLK